MQLDTAGHRSSTPRQQRASGAVDVAFAARDGRTVLADLRQAGSLKVRFPRGPQTEAVLLNTGGGVAGGDVLGTRVTAAAGTHATLTTAAAEKFYRALPDESPARVTASLAAHAARLEWLPQESILFDGARLARSLSVRLSGDACFLGIESLVFGRAAMGERVRTAQVADTIRIERDGRLILHDAIRLSGNVADILAGPAVAAGAAAAATMIYVAADAPTMLDRLRAALAGGPVQAGASCWDGMIVARLLAADGACLRQGIVAGLSALRDDPLPRVWHC